MSITGDVLTLKGERAQVNEVEQENYQIKPKDIKIDVL